MSLKSRIFVVTLFLAIINASCEEYQVELEYESLSELDTNDVSLPEESEAFPLTITWNVQSIDDLVFEDGLHALIENRSEYDLETEFEIVAYGLVDRSSEVDLGKMFIPAGESVSLDIPAHRLPIQSHLGASHGFINAMVYHQDSDDSVYRDGESGVIYYRHSADYSQIASFTSEFLIRNLGGSIFSLSDVQDELNKKSGSSIIGKVYNSSDDTFQELYYEDIINRELIKNGVIGTNLDIGDSHEEPSEQERSEKLENQDEEIVPYSTAYSYFKTCSHWSTGYVDSNPSGSREDIFYKVATTGKTSVQRPAVYTPYLIQEKVNGVWQNVQGGSGVLDINGCMTSSVRLVNGRTHRFRQATMVKRGSTSKIYLVPSGNKFGPTYYWYSTNFTAPSNFNMSNKIETPGWDEPQSRILPIAAHMLAWSNATGYNPNQEYDKDRWYTYIRTARTCSGCQHECDFARYRHESDGVYGAVCIPDSWSKRKFAVAHEIGHRIADAYGAGAFTGSSNLHSNTIPSFCHYVQLSSNEADGKMAFKDNSHSMQSLEFVGDAASEGFANFISSATFNRRSENDTNGWYGFSKTMWNTSNMKTSKCSSEVGPSVDYPISCFYNEDRSVPSDSPYMVNLNTTLNWRSLCINNTNTNYPVGTSWDWNRFFWKLYTAKTASGSFYFSTKDIVSAFVVDPKYLYFRKSETGEAYKNYNFQSATGVIVMRKIAIVVSTRNRQI